MFFLYLDPGSGSFLLQLLIAGLAGIGIAIGASWARIKRLFNKKKGEPASLPEDEDDEE
jgi:hypothetical protein